MSPSSRWQDPEAQRDRRQLSERQRKAFDAFIQAHGLKLASWARQAGLPNANALYAYRNGTTDFLSQSTLEQLVRAIPNATVAEILGEAPQPLPVRVLPCRAEARAGVWQSDVRTRVLREIEFPIPAKMQADELVKLADGQADKVYPPGSYLAIEGFASLSRPLRFGERVLVHAVKGGQHEITVRELAGDEAAPVLVFPSHSRKDLAALKMPIPAWPYDGRIWTEDGIRYQIEGRVVVMFMIEEPRYS
jgi:hypothetical protein